MQIILTLVLGTLIYYFAPIIRKNDIWFYIGAIVISLLGLFLPDIGIFEPLIDGTLGLVIWYIVMMAGALKRGSKLNKTYRSVRKELSIIGFIIISTHSLYYLGEMLYNRMEYEWYGIASYIIMIPLFYISFSVFKKLMNIKTWYNIQKAAYVIYLLIYIHLILVAPVVDALIYTAMFAVYLGFKLNYYVLKGKLVYSLASIVVVIAILFGTNLLSVASLMPSNEEVNVVSSDEEDTGILYADGTYTLSSYGYKTEVLEISLTLKGDYIQSIDIISSGTDKSQYEDAVYSVRDLIVSTNSTAVDTVAGASESTGALIELVADILESAKK
jgi:DMSO/TMAO reductase YedYZ heme-binding membrane subunit/uncharacterized protein with FMN-binding domain